MLLPKDSWMDKQKTSREYKKAVQDFIKYQIQTLVECLAKTGEETVVITASLGENVCSSFGSSKGEAFLGNKGVVREQFMDFCRETPYGSLPSTPSPPELVQEFPTVVTPTTKEKYSTPERLQNTPQHHGITEVTKPVSHLASLVEPTTPVTNKRVNRAGQLPQQTSESNQSVDTPTSEAGPHVHTEEGSSIDNPSQNVEGRNEEDGQSEARMETDGHGSATSGASSPISQLSKLDNAVERGGRQVSAQDIKQVPTPAPDTCQSMQTATIPKTDSGQTVQPTATHVDTGQMIPSLIGVKEALPISQVVTPDKNIAVPSQVAYGQTLPLAKSKSSETGRSIYANGDWNPPLRDSNYNIRSALLPGTKVNLDKLRNIPVNLQSPAKSVTITSPLSKTPSHMTTVNSPYHSENSPNVISAQLSANVISPQQSVLRRSLEGSFNNVTDMWRQRRQSWTNYVELTSQSIMDQEIKQEPIEYDQYNYTLMSCDSVEGDFGSSNSTRFQSPGDVGGSGWNRREMYNIPSDEDSDSSIVDMGSVMDLSQKGEKSQQKPLKSNGRKRKSIPMPQISQTPQTSICHTPNKTHPPAAQTYTSPTSLPLPVAQIPIQSSPEDLPTPTDARSSSEKTPANEMSQPGEGNVNPEELTMAGTIDEPDAALVQLIVSESVHHPGRPLRHYKCRVCGLMANSYKDVSKHIRTHTGERPFRCELCPKSFTCVSALYDHNRRHTGEQRHQCKECGNKFYTSSDLHRHRLQAHKIYPFTCKVCSKGFTVKKKRDLCIAMHLKDKAQNQAT